LIFASARHEIYRWLLVKMLRHAKDPSKMDVGGGVFLYPHGQARRLRGRTSFGACWPLLGPCYLTRCVSINFNHAPWRRPLWSQVSKTLKSFVPSRIKYQNNGDFVENIWNQ
jgi:hypothetical protein